MIYERGRQNLAGRRKGLFAPEAVFRGRKKKSCLMDGLWKVRSRKRKGERGRPKRVPTQLTKGGGGGRQEEEEKEGEGGVIHGAFDE